MDGAILVSAATDGVMPQPREHFLLARQVGVPKMMCVLNKSDMVDEEMRALTKEEAEEALKKQGYVDAPVIEVSALKALEATSKDDPWVQAVKKVIDTMEEYFPVPVRETEKPFLMPVEDIFSIEGRGTVVTGRIERGSIKVGAEIEVVGLAPVQKTTVTGIEMFNKSLDSGQAGDNAGILLRGIKKEDITRGQVLAIPGSVKHRLRSRGVHPFKG